MALKRGGWIKRKPKSEEEKAKKKEAYDRQWQLFLEVWEERGPFSQIDGAYLGSEPKSTMFDHLLDKSKYPHLRYEKENIYLVTADQHSAKTQGYPLPLHEEAIERAKKRFNIS